MYSICSGAVSGPAAGVLEASEFGEGHALFREADYVIFLGFGYLPENIERLQVDHIPRRRDGVVSTRYLGTGLGLTEDERWFLQSLFEEATKTRQPSG